MSFPSTINSVSPSVPMAKLNVFSSVGGCHSLRADPGKRCGLNFFQAASSITCSGWDEYSKLPSTSLKLMSDDQVSYAEKYLHQTVRLALATFISMFIRGVKSSN